MDGLSYFLEYALSWPETCRFRLRKNDSWLPKSTDLCSADIINARTDRSP